MNSNKIKFFIITLFLIMFTFFSESKANYEKKFYDFSIDSIDGKKIDFSKYKGQAVLLVNVASKCGFTKQYSKLQQLWDLYKDKGLLVIGFPSNQFGGQEPGTNKEIKEFCEVNFNINFPITDKIDVKGDDAHEIFKWAKKNYGSKTVPKWNFHKILINKDGKIEKTFGSFINPMSNKIVDEIEKMLNPNG
jgi:glutathione peroxidase